MKRDLQRGWTIACLSVLAGLALGAALLVTEGKARGRTHPRPGPPTHAAVNRGAAPALVQAPAPWLAARGQRQAVVVGSSSVKGVLGRVIADDLERLGFLVTRRGIVSAGLARPDYRDLHEVVDQLPISESTAAVFVYVGMNDGQSIWLRPSERRALEERWLAWHDPRWTDVYTRRARSLLRSICARGAGRAVVMLPVDVAKPSLERKLRRIRRAQRQAAREVRCASAISTSGDKGQFFFAGKPLRLRDGFHLTRRGAEVVWKRVQQRGLHLAPLLRSSSSSVR